ncbi:hypothetical protein ACFY2W_03975 [Streptomyces sp. NPDC001262]|uniref:hypothetical protein n=1 Tax=Streptomyces sp. NPDC001262 TaxID=3364552 RepID=UPI0036A3DCED
MHNSETLWFDSLTESVAALAVAARETRFADQATRLASWHVEPARIHLANGQLRVPGERTINPQTIALEQIRALCRAQELATALLYENTARAYAYGTAAAALAVAKGERPRFAELQRDEVGQYILPVDLLPDLRDALSGWAASDHLARLRCDVIEREEALVAGAFAADYETASRAYDLAAGLADSSYAYGEQAEAALHFLLMTTGTDDDFEEKQ